jgi:hypothetical protein
MTTDPSAHPDATQLLSIADLMPTLSGADPAMLANVGHYLRGLSDRVKVLPVARTGPLRVAAEAVSAPVGAVPRVAVVKTLLHDGHDDEGDSTLYIHGVGVAQMSMCGGLDHLEELAEKINKAATPPQAEPSLAQQLQNAREDFTAMKALTESGATEIARLTAELAQANAMCESLAASVQDLANAKAAVDEAHAIELADEKAVVDCLKSELADRLQKQRAAEAELQEARKDSARYRWLREQAWFVGPLCVLRDPKAVLTRGAFLGADCPSLSRLDDAIDAAMTKAKP